MINLNKIKLVLFDFDDTLCLHTIHKYDEEIKLARHIQIIKNENPWKLCETNIYLKEFMDLCFLKNIPMGLMSACLSYPEMKMKEKWIFKNYGYKMKNYCVTSCEKINTMIAISEALKIPREEILIVDDYRVTIEGAGNVGFASASPIEVVNFVINNRNK